MQLLLIVASLSALSFGVLATCLIARFLSDDVWLKGAHDGRYAYLGEDDVKEIRWPTRRERRLPQQRPTDVAIRINTRSSRWAIRRQALSCVRHVNPHQPTPVEAHTSKGIAARIE
jgi:hypothetical protein